MIHTERVIELAEKYFPQVITQRRYLHQHPELSFQEFNTSTYIAQQLDDIGVPYKKGYVKTGIVAHIKGRNPTKSTFALRGDMDALPIDEKTNLPYASIHTGIMHACGHDVHTSCLLGAAAILNELKNQFEGTVKLIFQPGEEVLPGGASLMIKEGALLDPKPDAIVAQHVYPQFEVGTVGFRPGIYMAACDEIHIHIHAKGGHAAEINRIVNPILIATQVITELNAINTLGEKKNQPTVISIGFIEGLGATNIVPDKVEIKGTIRTLDEKWRSEIHQQVHQICERHSKNANAQVELHLIKGYPHLENNVELTHRVKKYAIDLLGANCVKDLDIRMGGEDFSYYTQEMPGCFYRLGTHPKGKPTSGLHTNTFTIDENALKTGISLLSWITLQELKL